MVGLETVVSIVDEGHAGCVTLTARLGDDRGTTEEPAQTREACGRGQHRLSWALPFRPQAIQGELALELDVEADYRCAGGGERPLQLSYHLSSGPHHPAAWQPGCGSD